MLAPAAADLTQARRAPDGPRGPRGRGPAKKQEPSAGTTSTPLYNLATHTIVDDLGNPIAAIGPIDTDLSGRIAFETSQSMSFMTPYMVRVVETLRREGQVTVDRLAGVLSRSPAFTERSLPLLRAGLDAYFRDDHVACIHILVPVIEAALRQVAVRVGASVFKPRQGGGRMYRPLDELLRDPEVVELLGESVTHYLRVLLTDPRGWNVRNNVCHGLSDHRGFDAAVADRLLHVLTLLAQLKEAGVS